MFVTSCESGEVECVQLPIYLSSAILSVCMFQNHVITPISCFQPLLLIRRKLQCPGIAVAKRSQAVRIGYVQDVCH
jgi:hypothetical protein